MSTSNTHQVNTIRITDRDDVQPGDHVTWGSMGYQGTARVDPELWDGRISVNGGQDWYADFKWADRTIPAATTAEEQAVEIVARTLTAIYKSKDAEITEGMRLRARQIVSRLKKANLLATEIPPTAEIPENS